MGACRFLIGSLGIALLSWPSIAGSLPEVDGVRFGVDGRRTRVVIDLDKAVAFSATAENDPPRLVVDLPEVIWRSRSNSSAQLDGLAKAYRYDVPEPGKVRLIVDARAPFRVVRRFALEPGAATSHYRLVVDIEALGLPATLSVGPPVTKPAPEHDATGAASMPRLEPLEPGSSLRGRWTVVLDAGHGGPDPGAIGIDGSLEKTITLRMVGELGRLLDADGRYHVVLTREDDTRVPLRERVARARAAHADAFLSLHADSLTSRRQSGLSVFILSETAADEEAALLHPLLVCASIALGGMFGPAVRELTYCLAEGVKRGTIDGGAAKLILARVLPSSRPVQLDLPVIRTALDLIEAEEKIAAGINDGKISPAEALQLQAWAKTAYRSRRIADAAMGKR